MLRSDWKYYRYNIQVAVESSRPACVDQWRTQEFLSIGQPWAIKKWTGLEFFKTSYLFQSRCLWERKVNNLQPTHDCVRCLCTTSQNYFSTLKCFIIFRVKTTTITICFYGVTQVGSWWLRSPGGVRNYSP
jgi:hypothetical protein